MTGDGLFIPPIKMVILGMVYGIGFTTSSLFSGAEWPSTGNITDFEELYLDKLVI
jgi:hypothetical protein